MKKGKSIIYFSIERQPTFMKGLACTSKPYFFPWPLFFFIVSVYILDLQTFCNELLKLHFWPINREFSSIPETVAIVRECGKGEPSIEKDRAIT